MGEWLPGTRLEADRPVPDVPLLEARTGRAVSLGDFRHRQALVLAFLHEDCPACAAFAEALAGVGEDLRLAGAGAYAVLEASCELALPVLLDRGGRLRARLLDPSEEPPLVLVVDRFGAAWRSFPSAGHRFPAASEVAATLWHLALMCPECGGPVW
ncbi:MAG TPA: hypothetical protein VNO34_06275 [Actinomycetota bacterium]|nr:hypothetical protein [Actinomycetota bacterium]